MNRLVIIDPGHGCDTAGKCSPDGILREWQFSRALAALLAEALAAKGISSIILVDEDEDVSLAERCRRANAIARANPGAILVSLHSNASGDGSRWGSASGWSAFVADNASEESRRLAHAIFRRAGEAGILGNRASPPCGYNTAHLAICRGTVCPAVLTENMFHDNREDVAFMLSDAGKRIITEVHAGGIADYFDVNQ